MVLGKLKTAFSNVPFVQGMGGGNACKHSKRTTLLTEINENYKGKVHKLWREKLDFKFHAYYLPQVLVTMDKNRISNFLFYLDFKAADDMFAMTDVE